MRYGTGFVLHGSSLNDFIFVPSVQERIQENITNFTHKPKPERNLCKNERKNKIEGGEPHTNFFTSNFVLITKIRYISNFSTYTRFINFNIRKQDHKIIIV